MKKMKNLTFSIALLFAFFFAGNSFAANYLDLQNQNVLIEYDDVKSNAKSSGVLITKKLDKETYSFVLTCAHGLKLAKQEEGFFNPVSKKVEKRTKYVQLNIRHIEHQENGSTLEKRVTAEVFLLNEEDDMAVLLIKNRNFSDRNTKFASGPPKIGEKVITVGNLHGDDYSNSVGDGIIAYIDREINYKRYHQVTSPIVAGASGGGLYNDKDEYLGTIVRVREPNLGFVIPIADVKSWLSRAGADWLLDGKAELKDKSQLNLPVELINETKKEPTVAPTMPRIEFIIPGNSLLK